MRIKFFLILFVLLSLINIKFAYSQKKFEPKTIKSITCQINTDNLSGNGAGVFSIKESKVQGKVIETVYGTLVFRFKVTLVKQKGPKVAINTKPDIRVFHFDLDNPDIAFLDVIYSTGFTKESYDNLNALLDSPIGTEMEIEFTANISEDNFNINKPQTVYLYRVQIGERIDFGVFDSCLKNFIRAFLKADFPALAELVNFPLYNVFNGEYDNELTLENGSTVPNTKAGFLNGGFQALGFDENKQHNYTMISDKKYNYFSKVEGKSIGDNIVFKRSKKEDLTVLYSIRLEHNEHYDISLSYIVSPFDLYQDGAMVSFYFKKLGNTYKLSDLQFGM